MLNKLSDYEHHVMNVTSNFALKHGFSFSEVWKYFFDNHSIVDPNIILQHVKTTKTATQPLDEASQQLYALFEVGPFKCEDSCALSLYNHVKYTTPSKLMQAIENITVFFTANTQYSHALPVESTAKLGVETVSVKKGDQMVLVASGDVDISFSTSHYKCIIIK